MLNRRKNRRRQGEKRQWRLPQINWRRWLTSALSLVAIAGIVGVVAWALNQPIETVSISGSLQRVAAADVERAVKERVRGEGLVSVKLEDVRRAIDDLPWVDSASVE